MKINPMASTESDFPQLSNPMTVSLNFDVWALIFALLDREDFYNACLTSRAWNTMAMPYLHRSVPLTIGRRRLGRLRQGVEEDGMKRVTSLCNRLLDQKNDRLRRAVRELEVGLFDDPYREIMQKRLLKLVDSLPNLQRVKINIHGMPQKDLERLVTNKKKISWHLYGGAVDVDGQREVSADMPNVVALEVSVNPWYTPRRSQGPPKDLMRSLQQFFFACPNLNFFSFKLIGGYGGCMPQIHRRAVIRSFRFSGNEKFPPLGKLELSGYQPREDEWHHWQQRFQWSKLESLSLGPRSSSEFLKLATGYARPRDLVVQQHTDEYCGINKAVWEEYLMSFSTLESLTVRGYGLSPGLIGNHPGLKHLCLHAFEPFRAEDTRPTFGVEQLRELDRLCADIETLELDLHRHGEWPIDIIETLATGFKNLRRLTLHLEVGIKTEYSDRELIQPQLNEASAREIGEQFFNLRSSSSSPSSNLSVFALKTGEPLRRFPQREPLFGRIERENTITVEVHKPRDIGDKPKVVVLPQPSHWW
ncbi:hypothetical protein GGS20DRAFT_592077 [Poronia punctata]|nr:hypothetical protein GGS20DRAFT_592077 [Poronia punctata]